MKKLLHLAVVTLLFLNCAGSKSIATGIPLTFNYSTIGILEGYDHTSKLVVYDGDKKIGESTARKESEGNSVTIGLSKGSHKIRAVLNSQYEGNWEEHLKINDYSLDCLFDDNIVIEGPTTITLVFDITNEKTIVKR